MMLELSKVLEDSLFTDGDWIESKDQDINGGIKLIQLADIGDGAFINKSSKFINNDTAKRLRCTFLKKGDVLVARMPEPLGRSCVFPLNGDNKYITAVDVCILRPNNNTDSDFLSYMINSSSCRNEIKRHSTGTTRKRISRKRLSTIKIPLPPLETQKRIAQILDDAAALRDKTNQLLKEYDALAQSIFLDMFGDPVTNPKGWDLIVLGEISKLITKGSSPKWQGFGYLSKGVRFITSENVRLGYLDVAKDKYVAKEFHHKLFRSQLKPNDLLVNLVGASIGRGALVEKENLPANINQAVAKIEPNTTIVNPVFLLNLMITPQMQNELIGNKVEGARANISLKNVRELKIILPSIKIQNDFTEKLKIVSRQRELAKKELKEAEDLFNCLLQKAFKGELVK